MLQFQVKVGDRRGKLEVVRVIQNKNKGSSIECKCDCGELRTFPSCLVFGKAPKFAACNINGCRQVTIKHGGKIGRVVIPEYNTWSGMIQRCTNPKSKKFPIYGGRGITVCNRWMEFGNFLSDMGRKPSLVHTIDRIDVNKDYTPGNCRWATKKEQGRNTRFNRNITCDGVTMTVADWADKLGVDPDFLHGRVNRGWKHDRIIKEPRHYRGQCS